MATVHLVIIIHVFIILLKSVLITFKKTLSIYTHDLPSFFLQIEISTLSPDEDYSPAHGASLEEEEEEPEEELENEREDKNELPITPSLIPSGSGGVSMGPDNPGGLYYTNPVTHKHTTVLPTLCNIKLLYIHLTSSSIG